MTTRTAINEACHPQHRAGTVVTFEDDATEHLDPAGRSRVPRLRRDGVDDQRTGDYTRLTSVEAVPTEPGPPL